MRDQQDDRLKLGKGSYFVKSQLRRLSQNDDIWEADFFPVPQQSLWIGLVISHTDDFVLAHQTIEEPPTVNELARLLAEAIRRPLIAFAHRPRTLYLREGLEWVELLPHLKQVGIQVVYQDKLPKWDEAFGDLYAQVEENGQAGWVGMKKGRSKSRKELRMTRKSNSPLKLHKPTDQGTVRLYTLDVFIPRRTMSKAFHKNKSGVSRLIQIRGDQTLEDLHHAIFVAFDRWHEHLYEFQLGKGPRDRQGPIYTGGDNEGELASETTIDSLRLKVGRSFGYLFDFGDNWQHQINVQAIEEALPQGKFPRVTKRVGESPPQYPEEDE